MPILQRIVLLLIVAGFAAAAVAQEQRGPVEDAEIRPAEALPPAGGPIDADSFYGKESTQGVYVRDSAVALEKFPLANKLERLREWGKAADVLQEVLEKYPDRVIQSATDERGRIIRYTSVATAVQQQIARWPAEGLAAYRARFEAPAQAMLEGADESGVDALRKVYFQYFNTDPGKRAGMRLIDRAFRSGDFRAAADISAELLAWHPLLADDRPALLFRAALSHHLAGDAARAQAYRDELAKTAPAASAIIRGRPTPLAAALAEELQQAPAARGAVSADNWPLLGGDESRARVSGAGGRTGARLFRVPVSPRVYPQIGAEMRASLEAQDEHARAQGAFIGVIPSTDRGELFFQDGKSVFAVSLESGLPLPGWAATHGGDAGGAYVDPDAMALPAGQQLTVTLTDSEVLAIMGLPERQSPYTAARGENAPSRIVCLDRSSGRVKWMVQPRDLPEDGGSLRDLVFSGSPLVVGDSVHFIGRGGKSAQFEDCYVITLNLADGRHKWSTYIASANSDQMNMMGMGRGAAAVSPQSTSHLAHASGRLFVLTNLGAVAALDAYSGTIRWLSIYERDIETDFRGMRRRVRQQSIDLPRPWTFNPVMVADGRAFVLPSDADHLLIYDAVTGETLKKISEDHLADADTLVGVSGDRLVVAGEYRVTCLSHTRYDAATFRDNDPETIYWISAFPDAGEDVINPIRGRSFLTADSVFVPTQRGLFRMDLKTGRRVEQYPGEPHGANWAEDEGAGNVLVTGDRVIVAGERAVNVYTDLAMARAKLDAEVAAAPQEAGPRLRYAEVMFVAGQTEVALAKLDEAIQMLGGAGALSPGASRDRLFTAALTFAEKAAGAKTGSGRELARQLYDRAAVAAAVPSHQVNYRLSRARFALEERDLPAAIRLYQEILLDPAMRAVTISDARAGGATPAAVVAEREIGQLIGDGGADLYEPYEAAARQLAQSAAGEPDRLLEVARQYPNAAAAPEALLAAAAVYAQNGDHRRATQTLRQVSYKYGDRADRTMVLEAMARSYLAMGRVDVAVSRLAYGGRAAPGARLARELRTADGAAIAAGTAFADAAALLRGRREDAEAAVPDFALPSLEWTRANRGKSPFAAGKPVTLAGVMSVVAQQPDHARYDRIAVWQSDRGLALYDVGAAEPRGAASTITDAPAECAWTETGLVVRTEGQLVLLDPDTAAVRWGVRLDGLADAPLVESGGAGSSAGQPRVPPAQAEPVVVQGQIRMINNRVVAAPQPLLAPPQPVPGPEQFVQMRVTADRVLATTSTGRLVAVESATGKLAWQTRLLDDLPLDRLEANDDFAVVRVIAPGTVQLVVLDTLGGELVSRRSFGADVAQVPLNFALAGDGTLVYLLPDRLCGKDLYEPGDQLNWEVPGQAPGRRIFMGATAPDHLQIQGERILVLSDEGQFVRLHALDSGKMLRLPGGPGGQEIDALLGTESKGWDTRLLVHGPHLYIVSPRALVAYNLDRPEQTWRGMIDQTESHNFRQAMIGGDYFVLLESLATPGADAQAAGTTYRLHAFSRARTKNGESGLVVHTPEIRDPAGIESFIGVNGGFYYLSSDRTLHFLAGAGK